VRSVCLGQVPHITSTTLMQAFSTGRDGCKSGLDACPVAGPLELCSLEDSAGAHGSPVTCRNPVGGYPAAGAACHSITARLNLQLPNKGLSPSNVHKQGSYISKKTWSSSSEARSSSPATNQANLQVNSLPTGDPCGISLSRLCLASCGHLQTSFFKQTFAIIY